MTIRLAGACGDRQRITQGIFYIADLEGFEDGDVISTEWLGEIRSYRVSEIERSSHLAIAWLD